MRTLTFTLLLAAQALAQPASPASPAPAAPAVVAAPKSGDVIPEAQSIFDRAISAYRGAKTYRETVQTTLVQKVSGVPKDAEPPVNQASTTSFFWAGPDRYAFDARDFALFRDGPQATILVKALGEYVQRPPTDEDKRVFGSTVDTNPVFQALASGEAGKTIGRFATVSRVVAEEVGGVKGKRLFGTGLPPLPGYEILCPVTMFFADDTGLLTHATYDLKAIMQGQVDKARVGNPRAPMVTIDEFSITNLWTDAKLDADTDRITERLTFKPAPGDTKVNEFNMGEGQGSAQSALLNKPAPDFTATTFDGKTVSLKDLKGRVVLLQFWAAAVGQSTRALTHFNSMDMIYRDRGAAVYGVNQDHATMAEQSRRAAAAKGAAFPQIADPDKAVGNAFRVALLPCTIIIDKEGVIRSISTDFDSSAQVVIAGKLDKLLKGETLSEPVKSTPFAPVNPTALQPAPPPAEPAKKP
jgi:peroxiredoxin